MFPPQGGYAPRSRTEGAWYENLIWSSIVKNENFPHEPVGVRNDAYATEYRNNGWSY